MIPAVTIKAALAGFRSIGIDADALLAATGVTQADIDAPFASVPNEIFTQIWSGAFTQFPDPTLPTQAGFAVPYGEFGLLDHLVNTADSVGEGLHMLNLFLGLVATEMHLRFTHDDHVWVWVEQEDSGPSKFISEQWTLALIWQRFNQRLADFCIDEVHLSQSSELDAALFEAHWGVPVLMGQKHSGFRLKDGVWELPNRHADPLLRQTLVSLAEQAEVKQFDDAPLVYAVRTRLPEGIESGQFSAEDIAAEMGLSKRTLQRQLSAENVSFKELLDLYRQEQAMMMLQNGQRDMGQVAYSLGYNEQSSFNRAFKRWTGQSPSAWLRSM